MGSCFSRRSLRSSEPEFHTIRVVHLNGHVEDFESPVSASHVAGKPGKHFVCTPAQLLSLGAKPMRPDTLLEPGRIYFLLPYSALQADMSPLDYAAVAKKLTALAKTGRSDPNKSPGRSSPVWSRQGGSSPVWSSPSRSPSRFADAEMGSAGGSFGAQRSVRARSWKPILDPIREKSFHRRSESELQMQESNLEALKVE